MSTQITGTLVWYYAICPREAWLMAHELEPERNFDLLAEGRLNQEGDKLIVSEVKKSSRFLPATRLQLGYYLWRLDKEGMEAAGEILVPKERKREVVELTPELKGQVEGIMEEIETLVVQPAPPSAVKIPFCKNCAYAEFCWS
jgi:CRISPR-associated exonuclease Cas4